MYIRNKNYIEICCPLDLVACGSCLTDCSCLQRNMGFVEGSTALALLAEDPSFDPQVLQMKDLRLKRVRKRLCPRLRRIDCCQTESSPKEGASAMKCCNVDCSCLSFKPAMFSSRKLHSIPSRPAFPFPLHNRHSVFVATEHAQCSLSCSGDVLFPPQSPFVLIVTPWSSQTYQYFSLLLSQPIVALQSCQHLPAEFAIKGSNSPMI